MMSTWESLDKVGPSTVIVMISWHISDHVNKLTWITDEEAYTEAQIDDDEEIKEYDKHVPKEHLPLVVDCLKLSNHGPDRTTVIIL